MLGDFVMNRGYNQNRYGEQHYQQTPQQLPQQQPAYPPPQQPQGYYYPPPPRNSNKALAIIAVVVAVIVIVAVLAFVFMLPHGGGSSKTMWDIVKEYDTNHDGVISESEISNANLPDYNPGDTIHIKDTIAEVGDAYTLTSEDVNEFYEHVKTTPPLDLKAGDTYTGFALQSVLSHAHDNITRALSVVAVHGNLTGKYSVGDTIEFDTKVYHLTGDNISVEFTGATIPSIVTVGVSEGGTNKLIMSLTYASYESNNTKAVLDVSMSSPSSASFDNVHITLVDTTGRTGSANLDSSGNAVIYLDSAEFRVSVIDIDGNGMLSDGDKIVIDGGSNSVSGLTVFVSIAGYSGNVEATIP